MLFFSVYNKFKSKKWNTYDNPKRLKILDKVLHKLCRNYATGSIKLKLNKSFNSNQLGLYENNNGKQLININQNLLLNNNQFIALETILHEFRHAYQSHVANTNTSFWNFKAKKWKKNFKGYLSTTNTSFEFYSIQPIEADAQSFAIRQLKKHWFKFRKEELYKSHLEKLKKAHKNATKEAKQKHGIFYKLKLNHQISKTARKK